MRLEQFGGAHGALPVSLDVEFVILWWAPPLSDGLRQISVVAAGDVALGRFRCLYGELEDTLNLHVRMEKSLGRQGRFKVSTLTRARLRQLRQLRWQHVDCNDPYLQIASQPKIQPRNGFEKRQW